jgi:hypothetical protein
MIVSIRPSDHVTICPSDAYAAIGAQNLAAAFASSTATTTTRAVHYRFDTVAFLDPFMRVSAPSVQRLAAQGTQQRSGLLDALVIMSWCVWVFFRSGFGQSVYFDIFSFCFTVFPSFTSFHLSCCFFVLISIPYSHIIFFFSSCSLSLSLFCCRCQSHAIPAASPPRSVDTRLGLCMPRRAQCGHRSARRRDGDH